MKSGANRDFNLSGQEEENLRSQLEKEEYLAEFEKCPDCASPLDEFISHDTNGRTYSECGGCGFMASE